MKNFMQQNQYLIGVCIFLLVCQLHNTAIVISQTIDWEEEQSFCSNRSEDFSPITPLPLPPPPESIKIIAGYEKIHQTNIPIQDPTSLDFFEDSPPFYFQPYYVDYDCPNYDTIIVTPNIDWEQRGLSVILNPTETTEYTITYKVTKDLHCNSTYTMQVKIEILEACSFKQNDIEAIQAEFPWIDALENVCLNSIEVYEKNNTKYLMFNHPNHKSLFYQDGSGLCSDRPDYSCLAAYQLSNKVKTYACNQPVIENPVEESESTFNTYTWLTDFVDPAACNGESIYVYDADTYEFLIIKTNLGESLYKTNGDLICFSSAGGFSFIGLYNESRILDSWTCDTGIQGRESFSETKNQGIQIFPNPATDKLSINLQALTFEQPAISIYDVQGKQVKQLTSAAAFAGIVELNVEDLERGIYLVEVRTNENILTEKLLIK